MSTYRIKGSDGVVIESTKFLELPKAPSKISSGVQRPGMIRYNEEWTAFEGTLEFTDGSIEYRRFANLDDNGRLQSSQLPDNVTSGLKYIGTFSPISDDIDPPLGAQFDNLPEATTSNSGNYFIVRGIYDAAVAHFKANNPTTSPATFTPVNPSGQANWIEVKYYFSADPYDASRKTITNAFGRIIKANVPTGTVHYGLQDLADDNDLIKAFDTGNNPNAETAMTDTDWIISDSIKWTRQRQARTSIFAGAVLFDRTQLYSSNRLLPNTPTGTVQNVMDSMLVYGLRRSGDAMYSDGSIGSGRLGVVYGTATAPAIAFNNKAYDPITNPGIDPSKWSDDRTGIFHPEDGSIGFTSFGAEKLRISSTQLIFYPTQPTNSDTPDILFSGTGNVNLGINVLGNMIDFVSDSAVNVRFSKNASTFNGTVLVTGNITGNANLTIGGNTVLGNLYNSDTLDVNATSRFYGQNYFGELNNPKSVGNVFYSPTQFIGNTSYTNNSTATYSLGSELKFQNGTPSQVFVGYSAAGVMYFKSQGTVAEYDFSFDDPNANNDTIRLTRNGVKLPELVPIDDAIGVDGMIAYSPDRKAVIQKANGKWSVVGAGGGIPTTFTTTSWTLNGSYYTFTVTNPNIQAATVQELVGSNYAQVEVDSVVISSTNVVISVPASPDLRFNGRIFVQYA